MPVATTTAATATPAAMTRATSLGGTSASASTLGGSSGRGTPAVRTLVAVRTGR
ncbi:hypothetical protein [Streptomyces sp. NPDC056227]|uniref:hypothetical protein n=1 Tax=Streptomyces sp. NPDC056227 TaxID=3345753 RepID=UPI0035E2D567